LEGVKQVFGLFDYIGIVENRPIEVVELEGNRVFVEGRITIRGTSSGAQVDPPPFGQIIEFRDQLISRVDNYSDLDEARRAAGVSEA
jgi:hypothetical protein